MPLTPPPSSVSMIHPPSSTASRPTKPTSSPDPPSTHQLTSLPSELLLNITSHLRTSHLALCALAQVSTLLQSLAEPHIYRTLTLRSTAQLAPLLAAFAARPCRLSYVETLKVVYALDDGLVGTEDARRQLGRCLAGMTGVRACVVESPFDNFRWEEEGTVEWVRGDMRALAGALEGAAWSREAEEGSGGNEVGNEDADERGRGIVRGEAAGEGTGHAEQSASRAASASLRQMMGGSGKALLTRHTDAGLARLERLTIHSHGEFSDFWYLDDFHCLFRHPTLRFLHVSCVSLPSAIPELDGFARATPLATLIFDECDLNAGCLRDVLRTPKALKHLTLGENVYNVRLAGISPRLSRAPTASLRALLEVADSLESLRHDDPYWHVTANVVKQMPQPGSGLRDFHALRLLDIDPCSFLHQYILAHAQAPPNLETLRLHQARTGAHDQDRIVLASYTETLPDPHLYTHVPSLKALELAQGASGNTEITRMTHLCDEVLVRERHEMAYKLHTRGIAFRLHLDLTWSAGLMPPFLHREAKPELVCVYDSETIGFRRVITVDEGVDVSEKKAPKKQRHKTIKPDKASQPPVAPSAPQPCLQSPSARDPSALPPLTDQLNQKDITRMRNDVRRVLQRSWYRMEAQADSESEHDEDESVLGLLYGSGFEDESDDFEDGEDDNDHDWVDYDNFEEHIANAASADDWPEPQWGYVGFPEEDEMEEQPEENIPEMPLWGPAADDEGFAWG